MLELTFLVVVIALAVIVLRGSTAAPLDTAERLYLVVAPIPVILTLVLPGPVAMLMRGGDVGRTWALRLNWLGGMLSVALILAGVVLLRRRSARGRAWGRSLSAALLIAALPAVLVGLVALMYAI